VIKAILAELRRLIILCSLSFFIAVNIIARKAKVISALYFLSYDSYVTWS